MTDESSTNSLDAELTRIESLPVDEQINALTKVVELLETQLR